MFTTSIKSGLVVTLAVMFGIVQLICACMPDVNSATPQAHTAHQMSADMRENNMSAHQGHDMAKMQGHGEHNHEANCSHCDDTVVLAVNLDAPLLNFVAPATYKIVYVNPARVNPTGMADTNLAALRWLDPPKAQSSPSPIALHNRSLT